MRPVIRVHAVRDITKQGTEPISCTYNEKVSLIGVNHIVYTHDEKLWTVVALVGDRIMYVKETSDLIASNIGV